MVNLNEIIKQNKGGKPYTNGYQWWTLPGAQPYALKALKNMLIVNALERAELYVSPYKSVDRTIERAISEEEFYFDNLVGEEKIVLKFIYRCTKKVEMHLCHDGSCYLFVDGSQVCRKQKL